MEEKKRIDAIDALRGLSVILMVIHHFLLDLVELCGAPGWLFSNPVFNFLHYIFAGTFVVLSGVSSRFSHNNIRRGVICLVLAFLMTVVTVFLDTPILFGVLHMLSVCMIIFGLSQKLLDKIPRLAQPFIYMALLLISNWVVKNISIGSAARGLFMFGWKYPGFYSADYFPLFPWMFVFLLGTWAGIYIKERKLPQRFYDFTCPVLPAVGRRSLVVYILHQPVLYALIFAGMFIVSLI